MRPFDEDRRPFEQKIADAAKEENVELTTVEVAAVKQRIRFALMDSDPADLNVGQLVEWVRRIVPAMRRANAHIDQHMAMAGLEEPAKQHAGLFPESLLRRFAEGADPYQLAQGGGEVLCSIAGDRSVRFNPSNLVVTPLKVEE